MSSKRRFSATQQTGRGKIQAGDVMHSCKWCGKKYTSALLKAAHEAQCYFKKARNHVNQHSQ